jgi:hypothetical protein
MSATLRTRDGSFSAVAAHHAGVDARLGTVLVDLDDVLDWAEAQKLPLVHGEAPANAVARVNVLRREYELPLFRLKQKAGAARQVPAGAGRTTVARQAAPVLASPAARTVTAAPAETTAIPVVDPAPTVGGKSHGEIAGIPAIASTEDELLSLVTDYDGTKTGLVTPAVARWLLALNTGNRPMQKGAVDRFIGILRDGQWINTGEAIIVSKEGVLNDGQHRLAAIQESGIPAPCDVRFGIARAAFIATNQGLRRTTGQALALAGGKHASAQAAVARLLCHYDARQMARAQMQVEPAQVIKVVADNPQVLQVVEAQKKGRFAPSRTAPVGMILSVAARTVPMEKVVSFLHVLDTGLADDETNPARRLHVRLRDAAIARERLSQIDMAALTARAWNAWHAGRTLQHLRIDGDDRTSSGFPEVAA